MKQVKMKTSIRILAILFGLFLSVGAFAQSTITGQVTDASGEPIIGATVRVAGQGGGVITDIDGNFSIKAEPGSMLSVSYIGYKTVETAASQNMKIALQDDSQLLEDVVVIGYGTVKKGDLTGSVSAMKPDDMSKGITNNAADMLVGKVAGVDVITSGGAPGSGSQIRIRGGSSLNASNDPLLVIDGLTIDNNTATGMSNVLAMINPNDIETFNILKDASATAHQKGPPFRFSTVCRCSSPFRAPRCPPWTGCPAQGKHDAGGQQHLPCLLHAVGLLAAVIVANHRDGGLSQTVDRHQEQAGGGGTAGFLRLFLAQLAGKQGVQPHRGAHADGDHQKLDGIHQ